MLQKPKLQTNIWVQLNDGIQRILIDQVPVLKLRKSQFPHSKEGSLKLLTIFSPSQLVPWNMSPTFKTLFPMHKRVEEAMIILTCKYSQCKSNAYYLFLFGFWGFWHLVFFGGEGGGSRGGWLMKPELIISVTDKLQTILSGSFAVRPLKFF